MIRNSDLYASEGGWHGDMSGVDYSLYYKLWIARQCRNCYTYFSQTVAPTPETFQAAYEDMDALRTCPACKARLGPIYMYAYRIDYLKERAAKDVLDV